MYRLICFLALLGATGLLSWQSRPAPEPARPRLPADRDSNSAASYFYYGISLLPGRSGKAADAFHWASRLDPTWADPLYARRTALLLEERQAFLGDYLGRADYVMRNPEIQRIDSLAYYAFIRNPFVDRRLDRLLIDEWLALDMQGTVTVFDLSMGNPFVAGWLAYTQADFPEALKQYARALIQHPRDYSVH